MTKAGKHRKSEPLAIKTELVFAGVAALGIVLVLGAVTLFFLVS